MRLLITIVLIISTLRLFAFADENDRRVPPGPSGVNAPCEIDYRPREASSCQADFKILDELKTKLADLATSKNFDKKDIPLKERCDLIDQSGIPATANLWMNQLSKQGLRTCMNENVRKIFLFYCKKDEEVGSCDKGGVECSRGLRSMTREAWGHAFFAANYLRNSPGCVAARGQARIAPVKVPGTPSKFYEETEFLTPKRVQDGQKRRRSSDKVDVIVKPVR